MLQSVLDAGNRQKVMNHIRAVPGISHRIIGDIGPGIPQSQIVRSIEHAAVCVPPPGFHQPVLGFLRGRAKHHRSVEMPGQKGLGNLRPKIAQIDAEGITAMYLDVI